MSANYKIDPAGIDTAIQGLQAYLYDNLNFVDHESYGRVYKNPRSNGKDPEYYIGEGEYKEVFYDDTHNITSFFLTDNVTSYSDNIATNAISFIVQANLKELYPAVAHRADEELHRQIVLLIDSNLWGYRLTAIYTGVENVYNGLNIDYVRFDDMEDFHVVRFDIDINFKYKCND